MPTEALSPADARNYLGIGRQTVKGTGVVPAFFIPYVGQISFAHNPNIRNVREAGSQGVIARQVKDFLAPAAQAATPIKPDIAAALLAYALGSAPAPTGVGPYVHTITPSFSNVWLSTERNIADDTTERIIDSIISSFTLNYAKRDSGPELMLDIAIPGIRPTDTSGAPTAEVYDADRPFLRSDCTWLIDTSLTPTNVESATLAFAWRLDEAILADAVTRSSLVKLHLDCQIELVQLFETVDEGNAYRRTHYWDGAAAGTTPGEVVYPGTFAVTASYGAGAAQRTLEVEMPTVNWGEAELTEPDPDTSEAVRLTRRGVMVANPGGQPITITATNARSTSYLA